MSSTLIKMAAKQILGKEMKQYQKKKVGGSTDPYFTLIVDPRTGKQKKVKKQIPDYIPEHDAIILAKMRKRSYRLDLCLFDFAGIRFGWSSVIGIIPALGDVLDTMMALTLVWRCTKVECGLGPYTLLMMLINVAIDFVVGIVPLVGDLADAAFKANTRNVRELEKRLDAVYKPKGLKTKDQERESKVKEERRKSGLPYRPEYEAPPATVIEEFSDDELEERRQFVEQGRAEDRLAAQNAVAPGVAAPKQAVTKDGQAKRGSWFDRFRSGAAQPDVEKGVAPARKPTISTPAAGSGSRA